MRIAVGSDHAGYEGERPYKPVLAEHLRAAGHDVVEYGATDSTAVDYPDVAAEVCRAIQDGVVDCGILLCGTGIGMSIAANRFDGIRAANCVTPEMVRMSRSHNNANVLCLGQRVLSLEQCLAFIDAWLAEPFSGEGRHARRVSKIQNLSERVG